MSYKFKEGEMVQIIPKFGPKRKTKIGKIVGYSKYNNFNQIERRYLVKVQKNEIMWGVNGEERKLEFGRPQSERDCLYLEVNRLAKMDKRKLFKYNIKKEIIKQNEA